MPQRNHVRKPDNDATAPSNDRAPTTAANDATARAATLASRLFPH
jgi:hypothetical protein